MMLGHTENNSMTLGEPCMLNIYLWGETVVTRQFKTPALDSKKVETCMGEAAISGKIIPL